MTINWTVFLSIALLGAMAEFWTLKNPNIYQKSVSTGKVLVIAAAIALLPHSLIAGAVVGLLIARFGDLAAEGIYIVTVHVAVWLEKRRWDTDLNQREENQENLTTEYDGT